MVSIAAGETGRQVAMATGALRMTRILTTVLSFHWMIVFALLSLTGGDLLFGGPAMAGLVAGEPLHGLDVALSVAFGLAAVLFLWLLLSAVLERDPGGGETGEVARIAFAGGALALTFVVALSFRLSVGLMGGVGLQLAALLSSYLAAAAELRAPAPRTGEQADGARLRALDAAHQTLFGRPVRTQPGKTP
jgi:hypothetical protein